MHSLNKMLNSSGLRAYPPGIWTAMFVQAIRSTGFSIAFTYLPLYLYQQRNTSMTVVGTMIFISGIFSGFFQIIGGILADRFGHRRMFIIFQIMDTSVFTLLAVLIGVNAPVWGIFLVLFVVMIFGGLSAPAISAVVVDISQKSRLTESYGLMAIGGNLGWAIGPLTGGYLQGHTSYAWVFGIGAMVTALSLLGTFYLPKDTAAKTAGIFSKGNLKTFFSNSTVIVFCALCMLFFLETSQWGSTLSVFTVDRIGFSAAQYGLLMSISGILIVIFQYPISKRIEWLGFRNALVLGSLLYGVGFLSLAWVKSFIPAAGSITILCAGEMLFIPSAYAVIGKISSAEDRAKNMGLLGLCASLGSSLGPLLGGFLLDQFPTEPFYIWGPIALPVFVAAIGFVIWRGYSKTGTNPESQ
jgi:MFS family permease